ncbi:lisH domain-containing protein C1711.05 [Drosophila novamexicana]|uniref:lisH domain-containing protein C1711.05 n=1 Tax=Drosophila novamexicana TaxID=47314 RepID=UPI0011E5A4BC|nr:lisH domain-containing protein C1711.05 [Drosophila novamexicana]
MPKYVTGRCCPEYDNCPILDNNPPLSSDSSSATPSTAKPAPAAPPAGFNWNITIKEITKPTEIRITDDNHKPKQTIPTRKLIASVGYIERPLSHGNHIVVGQQLKPLVTYNADGLQPLAENDPSKVNIKREYTTEGVAGLLSSKPAAESELEPDTAGSDNIYHIISTTEGPNSSSSSSNPEQQLSTEGPLHIGEESSTYYGNVTMELESSTEGLVSSTSSSSSSESPASSTVQPVHHMDEDEVPQVESNPAYPSLPEDDFSLRDVNFPLSELDEIAEAENKDEQRSIISPFERDNKRTKLVTENSLDASGGGSGSGSGDLELFQSFGSSTENMLTQASSVEKVATSAQVPLMYSAEDSSAETRIQNVNELAKISARQSENETSGELDTGSGSGELREPTTPRANTRVQAPDIDELGSGAGQAQGTAQDPKADAESLKLDESQEQQADPGANTNAAGKASTRAEKSFVEADQRLERLFLQRLY